MGDGSANVMEVFFHARREIFMRAILIQQPVHVLLLFPFQMRHFEKGVGDLKEPPEPRKLQDGNHSTLLR